MASAVLVAVSGIFIRIRYPFIILRPVEKWKDIRIGQKLAELASKGPDAADANQGTLVAAILERPTYEPPGDWNRSRNQALAFKLLGRLTRPANSTLQEMLRRLDSKAKPNRPKSTPVRIVFAKDSFAPMLIPY